MKVTLVISSLGGGGAERTVSNMANYWAARGENVTILTATHGQRPPVYDLHPRVIHRDLGLARDVYRPVHDKDALRTLLELYESTSVAEQSIFLSDLNLIAEIRRALVEMNPDVIISFMDITNIRVLLAVHRLQFPVIISERCDPRDNFLGAGRELLRWRLYPTSAYLTALNPEVLRHFSTIVGDRGRLIPNPVLAPERSKVRSSGLRSTDHTLIAMGRLAYEKGFDLLIYAYSSIAKRHPRWKLKIFGEGPLRSELETLSQELGLSDSVSFPGFANQPFEAMLAADLFVLPSRSEGFGNVLTEAMACGLPVVSFDCPSGPRYVIRDGIDGVLVPPRDVPALAEKLDWLMGNEAERARLAEKAREVLERFGIEKVMAMWDEVVASVVKGFDSECGRQK